jgi:hypothetical protein
MSWLLVYRNEHEKMFTSYTIRVQTFSSFAQTFLYDLSAGNLIGMCMTNQAPKLRDLIYVNGLITSDLKM